jgi:hypothetical protein
VEVDLNSGAILWDFESANGNAGNLDFKIADYGKIYALVPGSAITPIRVAVFDVSGSIADV